MPNLDLTITKIMQGDTPVLRIMEGDTRVWPSGTDVAIDGILTNVTSSVSVPGSAALNSPLTITLTPDSSHIINQISVTMGGTDITSTAYNEGVITIASVTGDIIIHASAIEVITFQDATVKALCVEHWGGGTIEGEITPSEAAAVTDLGIDKDGNQINSGAGPFFANEEIEYFNEFRYFTGITGRGLHWQNTGSTASTYRGKFAACTSLKEITIPAIPTSNLSGDFYYCKQLEEIDLSNIILTASSASERRIAVAFTGCTAVKRVIFPSASIILDSTYQAFGGANSSACSNLEYIDFKNMDFRNYPTTSNNPNPMLRYCPKLAHLPSGMHNLKHTQSFAYNPLTHESAVALLNSLGTVTGQTITFNATTYQTLTAEEIAIGTNKGWTVVSA